MTSSLPNFVQSSYFCFFLRSKTWALTWRGEPNVYLDEDCSRQRKTRGQGSEVWTRMSQIPCPHRPWLIFHCVHDFFTCTQILNFPGSKMYQAFTHGLSLYILRNPSLSQEHKDICLYYLPEVLKYLLHLGHKATLNLFLYTCSQDVILCFFPYG